MASSSSNLFFKIILQTTLQRGNIQIPKKFIRIHGGELSNPVFLNTPDGIRWKVSLTRMEDGNVWFQNEWKVFARCYSLADGHLVMFEYNKNSIPSDFRVHIFDKCAVGIDYPLRRDDQDDDDDDDDDYDDDNVEDEVEVTDNDSFDHQISEDDDDCVQILDEAPYLKTKLKSSPPRLRPRDNKKNRSERVERSTNSKGKQIEIADQKQKEKEIGRPVSSSSHQPHKKMRTNKATEQVGIMKGKEIVQREQAGKKKKTQIQTQMASLHISPPLPPPRPATIVGTLRDVGKFNSKNPYFGTLIKTDERGDNRPNAPNKFGRRHLWNKERAILQTRNKSWPVTLPGRQFKFSGGWASFAIENGLVDGDYIIFELTNQENVLFHVHIFKRHT